MTNRVAFQLADDWKRRCEEAMEELAKVDEEIRRVAKILGGDDSSLETIEVVRGLNDAVVDLVCSAAKSLMDSYDADRALESLAEKTGVSNCGTFEERAERIAEAIEAKNAGAVHEKPICLDADGRACKLGDDVYGVKDGKRYTVVNFFRDEMRERLLCLTDDEGNIVIDAAEKFTHDDRGETWEMKTVDILGNTSRVTWRKKSDGK